MMRCAVIYSSRTGNTKMVAEAVLEALPEGTAIYPVASAPDPESFDFLALGFWADKGKPDAAMQTYMDRVAGKNRAIGLFGTLGAYPDSDHGKEILRAARESVAGNRILGEFLCMGKIDPNVLQMMEAMRARGKDQAHPMTPERAARIKEAEKHPDAADLENARIVFRDSIAKAG